MTVDSKHLLVCIHLLGIISSTQSLVKKYILLPHLTGGETEGQKATCPKLNIK